MSSLHAGVAARSIPTDGGGRGGVAVDCPRSGAAAGCGQPYLVRVQTMFRTVALSAGITALLAYPAFAHHPSGASSTSGAGPIATISATTLEKGHSVAGVVVGHDAAGHQAGDLAHQHPPARGLESHRALLVLLARLLAGGVEEPSRMVPAVGHPAVRRIPVHVHVEHVHEDRDPARPGRQELGLVDLAHAHHQPVGGGDHQPVAPRALAGGVAEERDDPQRDRQPCRRRQPP